jgi:hypothetical protein
MIEQRLEELQKELDELKAQMKQPEDRFVPKVGERYWLVDSYGDYGSDIWSDHVRDNFRLATGNCGRTKSDARRHKASLFVKTPTGPCPKVGDECVRFSVAIDKVELGSPLTGKSAVWLWTAGDMSTKGYAKELEAKWRRYGWSVTGEPEPEGWES